MGNCPYELFAIIVKVNMDNIFFKPYGFKGVFLQLLLTLRQKALLLFLGSYDFLAIVIKRFLFVRQHN